MSPYVERDLCLKRTDGWSYGTFHKWTPFSIIYLFIFEVVATKFRSEQLDDFKSLNMDKESNLNR